MLSGVGPARHLESLGIAVKADPPPEWVRIITIIRPYRLRSRCAIPRPMDCRGAPCRGRCGTLRICTHASWAAGEQCVRVDRIYSQRRRRRSPGYSDRVSTGAPQPEYIPPAPGPWLRHEHRESPSAQPWRSETREQRPPGFRRSSTRISWSNPQMARHCCAACISPGNSGDTPAFASYKAVEVRPRPQRPPRCPDLEAYLRLAAGTVHHPVGSCRMGIDTMAVVDPSLRVRGIDRAAGGWTAQVFPGIVGCNTNAPIVMVAEKAAALIKGRT